MGKAAAVPAKGIQLSFPCMAKRSMTQIVAQSNGLRQILIQAQRTGNAPGDLGNLQGMGQAGTVMVSFWRDKHLCFMLHAAKGFAMDDTVSVPLEIRTDIAFFLFPLPTFCMDAFCSILPQHLFFQFFLKLP